MKKQKMLDLKKIAMTDRPDELLEALEEATVPGTSSSGAGTWTDRYTASGKVPAGVSPWTEKFTASGKVPAGVSPWRQQFTATGKVGGKPPP